MLAVGEPVVCRSLGQCFGGSVLREMGLRDGVGLLRMSGLGGVTKTLKFKPKRTILARAKRCVLDLTCTVASDVASPKMVRFIPVNGY
jgi:hypothetical protein